MNEAEGGYFAIGEEAVESFNKMIKGEKGGCDIEKSNINPPPLDEIRNTRGVMPTTPERKLGLYIIQDIFGGLDIAEYVDFRERTNKFDGYGWIMLDCGMRLSSDEFFAECEGEQNVIMAGPIDLNKLVANEVIRDLLKKRDMTG